MKHIQLTEIILYVNDQQASADFNSKTINTDIKHGQERNTGKTKGILIKNGMEYKIDDKGNKQKL